MWVIRTKEGKREVLGIVTEKDFLDLLNPLPDRMYTTGVLRTKSLYHGDMSNVEEFMTTPVITCTVTTSVAEVLEKLWHK